MVWRCYEEGTTELIRRRLFAHANAPQPKWNRMTLIQIVSHISCWNDAALLHCRGVKVKVRTA